MKAIRIINSNLAARAKTAMLTVATKRDTCRIEDVWHNAHSQWQPGQRVVEINVAQRQQFSSGDVLVMKNATGVVLAHIQILSITMVNAEDLTAAQIECLGYPSREDYETDWDGPLEGKGWYIQFKRLTSQQAKRMETMQ